MLPPNDKAQLRRGLLDLRTGESSRTPAVCCSDWLAATFLCPLLKRPLRMNPWHVIYVTCHTL